MMVLLNPPKRKRRKGRSKSRGKRRVTRKAARRAPRRRRKTASRRRRSGVCRGSSRRAAGAMRRFYGARVRKLITALRSCKGGGSAARRAAIKDAVYPTGSGAAMKGPLPFFSGGPRAFNGRRRRRRNGSARYSYRRNQSSGGYVPAFASNPSGVMAGFNVKQLSGTVPVLAGFIGNQYVTSFLGSLGFVPSFLRSGVGGLALGGLSAGLVAMAAGYISPSMSKSILLGGVIEVVTKAARQFVLPMVGLRTMAGMEDYLTPAAAMAARPLGDYLTPAAAMAARPLNGMGDIHGVLSGDAEALGDYLTNADAASAMAHPLSGMSGDIQEEVAGNDLD